MSLISPQGAFLSLFNPDNWANDPQPNHDSDSDDSDQDQDHGHSPPPKQTGPFTWPAWQARTGIMQPIFSPTPYSGTPSAWQNEADNELVWSFVTTFWNLPQTKRVDFVACRTKDSNSAERILFLDWYNAESSKSKARWCINDVILSSLCEHGVDPYSTLKLCDSQTKVTCSSSLSSSPH